MDRVLDRGLVIHADIIISLSGVPLIGVNLRAAIAGMETMLEYGMMRDWDAAVRACAREDWKDEEPILVGGEKLILKVFGTCYYSDGVYNAWKPSYIHLTNNRLLLSRKEPSEVLFETSLDGIRALEIGREPGEREVFNIALKTGDIFKVHTRDIMGLKERIEETMKSIGIGLGEEKETCPNCGKEAPINELLTKGCSCGWISPKTRKDLVVPAEG